MPERIIGIPVTNANKSGPKKYLELCVKIKYKMGVPIIVPRPIIIRIVPPINSHLHATKRNISNIIVGWKQRRKSPGLRGASPNV